SVRGTQGGFILGKTPSEMSLKEVLDALQPKKGHSPFCQNFRGLKEVCANIDECSVRPLWSVITAYFDFLLTELNLDDLTDPELNVRNKVKSILSQSIMENSQPSVKRLAH